LYYYFSCSTISSSTSYADQLVISVDYDSDYSFNITAPSGYALEGIYTEENGQGTKLADSHGNSLSAYNYTTSLNAYIYFIEAYKIKFENVDDATHDNQSYIEKDSTLTLEEASKDGYTFLGWYTTSDFSQDPITELSNCDSDITYMQRGKLILIQSL
jgi:uncharacterized repeat protein (TIGR02543 family)